MAQDYSRLTDGDRLKRPRRAFTLVELMVVMTIIAVLISLLLPAIQGAREGSRLTQCRSHLMQIVLAMHHYEIGHNTLPPGVVNPTAPIRSRDEGMHHNWISQLLPYVDLGVVFANINFRQSVYAPAHHTIRQVTLATFICPSMIDARMGRFAVTGYAGCHHDVDALIDVDNHGLLFLNSRLRIEDIPDGSRHTLLLGESHSDLAGLGWMSGTSSTLRNAGAALNAITGRPANVQVGGFSSPHEQGVHFAFADGYIHFINENIDVTLLGRLAHRSDGHTEVGF